MQSGVGKKNRFSKVAGGNHILNIEVREEKTGKEKMGIAAATPLFDIVTPLPKYMMIKYLLLSNKTCYQDSLAFVANLDNIQ